MVLWTGSTPAYITTTPPATQDGRKDWSIILRPEPNAPIIVLRSDSIRVILPRKVIEIRLPSGNVHSFTREVLRTSRPTRKIALTKLVSESPRQLVKTSGKRKAAHGM